MQSANVYYYNPKEFTNYFKNFLPNRSLIHFPLIIKFYWNQTIARHKPSIMTLQNMLVKSYILWLYLYPWDSIYCLHWTFFTSLFYCSKSRFHCGYRYEIIVIISSCYSFNQQQQQSNNTFWCGFYIHQTD